VTNGIIFRYARRSSQRVQPLNGDSVPTPALGHRDARLLKHMIFMFVVLFCGWMPAYVTAAITWNTNFTQSAAFQGLKILPAVSLFINVADLFWYNHELRRYFTDRINNHVN
jgi:hypothetical protein